MRKALSAAAVATLLSVHTLYAAPTVPVVTWNIEVGTQTDAQARQDMDFLVALTPVPQIILLNEAKQSLESSYVDELQTKTGLTWTLVFKTHCPPNSWNGTQCTSTEDEGVAILTSLPVSDSSTNLFPYADCYHSARAAARAAITVGGTTLQVFTTHLQAGSGNCGLTSSQIQQARLNSVADLKSWAANYGHPQIVGGDFNALPGDTEIASTTQGMAQSFTDEWAVAGSGNGFTWSTTSSSGLSERIDYWFADNAGDATVNSITVPNSGTMSDHLPVAATFALGTVSTTSSNLLAEPGFEGYTPPALGTPGWVSDSNRQTPAVSDSTHPHSGSNDGLCSTSSNLDCGIFQNVPAPATGNYTLTFYANANKTGGLVGANVNGSGAASSNVAVRPTYGDTYTMAFSAAQGQTIQVWMYSPNTPGYVSIDDVTLAGPNLVNDPGFESDTPPTFAAGGWVSDTNRQSPAASDTSSPHSGTKNGICSTTTAVDCGLYQDIPAPVTGTYMVTFYANANKPNGLVGVNVNTVGAASSPVAVRTGVTYGDPYTMTFTANQGDTIRVWMYAPAAPGYVVVDDVSLTTGGK